MAIEALPVWFQSDVQALHSGNPVPPSTNVGVSLSGLDGWTALHDGQPMKPTDQVSKMDAFGRRDGGFFAIKGATAEGPKGSYGFPILEEQPDPNDPLHSVGVGVMFIDMHTQRLLVQLKKMPLGTELAPTVQASYTNLKQNRDKIPFGNLLHDPAQYDFMQQFNPDRVKGPVRFGFEVVDGTKIDLTGKEDNYRWLSIPEINALTVEDKVPGNAFFDGSYKLVRAILDNDGQRQEDNERNRKLISEYQRQVLELQTKLNALDQQPQHHITQAATVIEPPQVTKKEVSIWKRFVNFFRSIFPKHS